MTTMISTGLAKALLDTGSLKTNLTGMKLKIYAGTVPASADAALAGATLLCTITDNGGGGALTFNAAAVGNVIEKNSSQVWSGVNAATGTATFCRLELASDTGAASSTEVRMQGDVGVAGKFLNLSSVALTSGATQTVDYLSIAMPTQ
ncbi:hypothetical protein D3C81_914120 [compost metagenome]